MYDAVGLRDIRGGHGRAAAVLAGDRDLAAAGLGGQRSAGRSLERSLAPAFRDLFVNAATSVEWSLEFTALSMMSFIGYIGALPR